MSEMRSNDLIRAIYEKIKSYDRIMLFRHIRPDGDCVGSTKGMKGIILNTFPEKEVYLIDEQKSDFLSFMGEDDAPVADEMYTDALGIVIDTATTDRISNKKFALCKEIIKIDHHLEREPYGVINWVEEEASSACEMIAKFFVTLKDQVKIDRDSAAHIYTGMVTDSGRFRYDGVSGDTLRYAAALLDQGIDTETLYAHLYLQNFETLKFKSHVYQQMQMTDNGVAYIFISREMQQAFDLDFESASACVSYMDAIKGCLCWLAFIENTQDQTIRVRLRSRFAAINEIAEKYHGGGHACASGATVFSREEMDALIRDADAHIKAYKENYTGWL